MTRASSSLSSLLWTKYMTTAITPQRYFIYDVKIFLCHAFSVIMWFVVRKWIHFKALLTPSADLPNMKCFVHPVCQVQTMTICLFWRPQIPFSCWVQLAAPLRACKINHAKWPFQSWSLISRPLICKVLKVQ